MQSPWTPQPVQTQMREYKDRQAFEREATRLAYEGWRVMQVTEDRPMGTLLRRWLRGALFFRTRRRRLIVTYERG